MANKIKPVLKSFLLCRQILSDPNNGQISLVNLVHAVRPSRPETFYVYMTLTEVTDRCEFKLVFEMQPETIHESPEVIHESVIPRQPEQHAARLCMYHIGRRYTVTFPRDGTCNINLYADNEWIESFPVECSGVHTSNKHSAEPGA